MHCKSCVILTEEKVGALPHVSDARSDLSIRMIEVCGDFGDKTEEMIAEELSEFLQPHGYRLSLEAEKKKAAEWNDFKIAIPVALLFMGLFVMLQKIGIINVVDASNVSYGVAFGIGIVASLSTCMAVVGGLVLSLAATFNRSEHSLRPQVMFHVGRLVTFFVLGGVIGMAGAVFALSATTTFILTLLIGIVMLLMALNLLGFSLAKKLQPIVPKFLSKGAFRASRFDHPFAPFLIGAATFFLPCGFTQSMQIYTLSTGTFFSGALTMLAFALGTLPVLAVLSFSSFNIQKSARAGVFLKSAGLIVLLFAVFNIINSLAIAGIIPPVFNF